MATTAINKRRLGRQCFKRTTPPPVKQVFVDFVFFRDRYFGLAMDVTLGEVTVRSITGGHEHLHDCRREIETWARASGYLLTEITGLTPAAVRRPVERYLRDRYRKTCSVPAQQPADYDARLQGRCTKEREPHWLVVRRLCTGYHMAFIIDPAINLVICESVPFPSDASAQDWADTWGKDNNVELRRLVNICRPTTDPIKRSFFDHLIFLVCSKLAEIGHRDCICTKMMQNERGL